MEGKKRRRESARRAGIKKKKKKLGTISGVTGEGVLDFQ